MVHTLQTYQQRPEDRRFDTLDKLIRHARKERKRSQRFAVHLNQYELHPRRDGNLALIGKSGSQAILTEHSFSQLCQHAGAPTAWLQNLSAETAAAALNESLQRLPPEENERSILVRDTGKGKPLTLSGFNSLRYQTVWNADALEMITQAQDDGWDLPHKNAAYYSDHNMFAFFHRPNERLADGTDEGLSRGFFLHNSEVGNDHSLRVVAFLFRWACGNMQIFGMQGIEEIRIPHLPNAEKRLYNRLKVELDRYALANAKPAERIIQRAQKKLLGKNKEKVIDTCYTRKVGTKKALTAGYAEAEKHSDEDGDPRSVWGMLQGLTRYSQSLPYGDQRVALDRDAGRLMALVN